MTLTSNENKSLGITVNEKSYNRYAIKTHFVTEGESYIDLFKQYVLPHYKPGDIVSSSEKIIALCQKRTIKREELPIGLAARILSKFASHPDTGIGVGEAIKMQFAINTAGLFKVLYASFMSAVTKLMGKKGVFYEIVGQEVSGLDGFYDHVWPQYRDIGILLPAEPNKVCNEIKQTLGISVMIVDANDFGQEILGKSSDITFDIDFLRLLIKDNPAGQDNELTPFILIREEQ